jgi:transposase-like protein
MTHEEKRERRKLVAQAIKAGKSPAEVARKYGVGLSAMRDACAEHGVEFPSSRKNVVAA